MGSEEAMKRPQEEADFASVDENVNGSNGEPALKRVRLEDPASAAQDVAEITATPRPRVKGIAPIKKEYLVLAPGQAEKPAETVDDDAAEGRTAPEPQEAQQSSGKAGKRKKQKGQNKEREFGTFSDATRLCNSVAWTPEFSPRHCKHGDRCNALHDIRKYLKEGRRPDLDTFGGKCPVWEKYGRCPSGWRCLFVQSHMDEVQREDGRSELVLVGDARKQSEDGEEEATGEVRPGVVNMVPAAAKIDLSKKKIKLEKSDQYLNWLAKDTERYRDHYHKHKNEADESKDYRAQYVEPPFKPSEKRRVYFGRETPVLAPLTTQGNLPFRRLCVELGAQVTYSEMALGLPLLQGQKADWTLMRAHETEVAPPRFDPGGPVVQGYDNSKDLKFGAQIAANVPWIAIKATEVLSQFLPHLRLVDLNCGCPVDMVYKSGAGSALLDAPSKLERMIRGMSAVSGEIPVTAKIRMGVRDDKLTAQKLVERLALGSEDMRGVIGAPGCAAVTLHGRTRQQRYTRAADWSYIAECAALIKQYNEKTDELADTVREAEENTISNGGKMYFVGNGDCYSHLDYLDHVDNAKVDSVMIGRGALVKPWIFEEIEKNQYLDKSASERLTYVEKFVRYGMEAWGSDELGLNYTRRFLLEFLSFFHRYVPIGLLEYLPPTLNDRPPAYRGRDDLETLLASKNYKDWIKISEMFLGPAPPGFKFQPKHKSNSYEIEAEG
ncbi:FMN-linked oxidoreductase [Parathielavia hyrcaniae]|uniref:tRNA-dihydrouridine(47) synthase [NAD(P)(+)] n=1 Tax=Parathielavia hyrcaniae TaxID=113614 RepID=A0AAN6Q8S2_9PEZI|nr:FMN-linked oxidoreductase [Parathielavia hyrcaniae]